MNLGALFKNVAAGAINGFIVFTGASAVTNVSFGWAKAAVVAAGVGGLRALQEALLPTAFVRQPSGPVSSKLAAKPSA